MPKILLATLFCSVLLSACGQAEKTSSNKTIPTSAIGLSIDATVLTNGTTRIFTHMMRQGTSSQIVLRLGGGDKLILVVDGTEMPLEEKYESANPIFPDERYYYELTFNEDISASDIKLVFSRPKAQDAVSPIQFGTSPDIITPAPDTAFSVSSDDVVITFPPDTAGPSTMSTSVEDSCGRSASDSDPLTTLLILSPAARNCAGSLAWIIVTRSWYPPLAPTLNQELSYTRTRIRKEIYVQYLP